MLRKTKDELNELKEEYIGLNKKLAELSDDELKQVTGGKDFEYYRKRISEIEYDKSLSISEKEALLIELKNKAANDPELICIDRSQLIVWITGLLGNGR